MRVRTIKRVRDLMATQDRVVIAFEECTHFVSLTRMDMASAPVSLMAGSLSVWPCHFCADAPPAERSATQLWREAGEP